MSDEGYSVAEASLRALDLLTPKGWARTFVAPPWKHAGKACRACQTLQAQGPWFVVTVARRRESDRTLLYSFGMVCGACWEPSRRDATASALGSLAFGPKGALQ